MVDSDWRHGLIDQGLRDVLRETFFLIPISRSPSGDDLLSRVFLNASQDQRRPPQIHHRAESTRTGRPPPATFLRPV